MFYKKPISIKEYDIYDIFINDCNKLVIIRNYENFAFPIYFLNPKKNEFDLLSMIICPHNHNIIYQSNDEILIPSESEKQEIQFKVLNYPLNVDRTFSAIPNRYPSFTNQIIMSTLVKNEELFIKQWVEYYKNLGVDKFIIYDNSSDNNLGEFLKEYIEKEDILLIEWNYCYYFQKSGFSAQSTQQNHSIYLAQNAKYIGMFDVDEYINLKEHMKIDDFFNKLIDEFSIDIKSFGSFCFYNRFFHNPRELPTSGTDFFEIYDCEEIIQIEKNFVIPKQTIMYSIHQPVLGKQMYRIPKDYAYYNHYCFLNKKDRGNNQTIFKDTSIKKHLSYLSKK
jgi:hypothetical protein